MQYIGRVLMNLGSPPLEDDWVTRGGDNLIVLIPGVNQSRLGWHDQRDFYQKFGCALYAPLPYATEETNSNIAHHVAKEVRRWRETGRGKVVVIGFSNGGRVACFVAERVHVDVVITIGSPLATPGIIEAAQRWIPRWVLHLAGWLYIGVLFKELVYNDPCPVAVHGTEYVHIASENDGLVYPPKITSLDGLYHLTSAPSHRVLMYDRATRNCVVGILDRIITQKY